MYSAGVRGGVSTATRTSFSGEFPAVHPAVWAFFVAAVVLDATTTVAGLSVGLAEVNPVAASAFDLIGVLPSVLVLKGAVTLHCLVVAAWLPRRFSSAPFLAAAAVWTTAAVSNLALITSVVG